MATSRYASNKYPHRQYACLAPTQNAVILNLQVQGNADEIVPARTWVFYDNNKMYYVDPARTAIDQLAEQQINRHAIGVLASDTETKATGTVHAAVIVAGVAEVADDAHFHTTICSKNNLSTIKFNMRRLLSLGQHTAIWPCSDVNAAFQLLLHYSANTVLLRLFISNAEATALNNAHAAGAEIVIEVPETAKMVATGATNGVVSQCLYLHNNAAAAGFRPPTKLTEMTSRDLRTF